MTPRWYAGRLNWDNREQAKPASRDHMAAGKRSVLTPDAGTLEERKRLTALNQSMGASHGINNGAANTSTARMTAFVARLFQGRFEVRVSDGGKHADRHRGSADDRPATRR